MTHLFRLLIVALWCVLLAVSVHAVNVLGIDGSHLFLTDFAHPWRAQFNTDFSIHLLLMALWVIYREPRWWLGIVCAILCVLGGGIFSLAYLLLASLRSEGNMQVLLMGKRP